VENRRKLIEENKDYPVGLSRMLWCPFCSQNTTYFVCAEFSCQS